MPQAYTKELLVSVYTDRYKEIVSADRLATLEENANRLYDTVGRDKFRQYASVTPEAIREFNKKHSKI